MISLFFLLFSSSVNTTPVPTTSPCEFLVEVYMTENYDGTKRNSSRSYDKKLRRTTGRRIAVCKKIQRTIETGRVFGWYHSNPLLPLVIAYRETGFTERATSRVGAKGPLQVIKHYWCPKKKKCDLIRAGLNALQSYKKRHKTLCAALAAYNGGSCTKNSYSYFYAQRIITVFKRLQQQQRKIRRIALELRAISKQTDKIQQKLKKMKERNKKRQAVLNALYEALKQS